MTFFPTTSGIMLRGRLERQQRWHLAPLPLLLLSVASGLLSRVDAYQVMM